MQQVSNDWIVSVPLKKIEPHTRGFEPSQTAPVDNAKNSV